MFKVFVKVVFNVVFKIIVKVEVFEKKLVHVAVGADTDLKTEGTKMTKKSAVMIKIKGLTGGTGNPGGSPVLFGVDISSAGLVDGAGIKSKAVRTVKKYDIAGEDSANYRANDTSA